MPGKKNHKKVVAKCFIAGAMANLLFTLVMVAGSSAEPKQSGKVDTKPTAKSVAKPAANADAKTTGKADESPAKPSVGKVQVWELQQQCKGIKEVNCLISQEAVRIRADKMNITFLFKAPKWDAYMYNTDTKNYCSFPYEEWRTKGFFSQVMKSKRHEKDRNKNLKVKKTGKSQQIAGQKAIELAIDTPEGERYASIWATPNLKVPKQFSEVIGSLVMVPIKESGAPLRVEVRLKSNVPQRSTNTYNSSNKPQVGSNAPVFKIEPVLDTTKAVDKQVDASIFDQPTGYKKVRDEMALLFAEKDDEEGDQSMFNFDSDPKLKKKPLPR